MSTDQAPTSTRYPRRRPGGPGEGTDGGSRRSTYASDFDDEYDDWQDEPEFDDAAPRILWGRIAFFAGALLLVFILGRLTADGGDQAAEAALTRVDELTAELEQARAEIDALEAGGTQSDDGAGAPAADAAAAEVNGAAEAAAGAEAAPDEAAPDEAAPDEAAPDEAAPDDEAGTAAAEPDTEPTATTYTVQPGDYLFGLAERFYNNGRLWQVIAEANDLGPGAVISPGQTLTIPSAP